MARVEQFDPGAEYSTATGPQSLRCTRVFFQAFATCKSLLEGYPQQNVISKN